MALTAQVVAHVPGRTRLRIASRKGNGGYFQEVHDILVNLPQVHAVTVRPATGSVLIVHDGSLTALGQRCREEHLFQFEVVRNDLRGKAPSSLITGTMGVYRTLDERVKSLTGGEIDLARASVLALVGTGFYQIARGRFGAPAWYTAFWYALNIFLKAKSRSVAGEPS